MIRLKTDSYFDSFKIEGTLEAGAYADKESVAVIKVSGQRKSEAVEKSLQAIDELIEKLKASKKEISKI